MLIFIKSWITPPQDSPSKESLVEVQKAYRVENIKEVSEVNALTNPKGKFRFSILLVTAKGFTLPYTEQKKKPRWHRYQPSPF